ncbi:hypothetical protein ACFQO4_01000 [Saliphagus sp. GCM10025334]
MSTKVSEDSQGVSSRIDQSVKSLLEQPLALSLLFGFGLLLIGAVRGDGVVAGMLGIYGATVILVSVGIYVILAVLRRGQ